MTDGILRSVVRRWRNRPARAARHEDPPAAALRWIETHSVPGEGVIIHTARPITYEEVTGYTIPTLLDAGRTELARTYLACLLERQRPEGWWGDGESPYIFDTCQIMEGLAAWLKTGAQDLQEETRDAARRAFQWLLDQVDERGLFSARWHDPTITEQIQLRSLRNLCVAAKALEDAGFESRVREVARAYLARRECLAPEVLSHFYAYEMDGVACFAPERARKELSRLASRQRHDGSFPAFPSVGWVCFTGVAQFAILLWQFGHQDAAKRAMDYLVRVQRPSGGFTGGSGSYFPSFEISWASKFFLDAWYLIHHGRTDLLATPPPGLGA